MYFPDNCKSVMYSLKMLVLSQNFYSCILLSVFSSTKMCIFLLISNCIESMSRKNLLHLKIPT